MKNLKKPPPKSRIFPSGKAINYRGGCGGRGNPRAAPHDPVKNSRNFSLSLPKITISGRSEAPREAKPPPSPRKSGNCIPKYPKINQLLHSRRRGGRAGPGGSGGSGDPVRGRSLRTGRWRRICSPGRRGRRRGRGTAPSGRCSTRPAPPAAPGAARPP